MELLIKFLLYFGLITKPVRILRVGDIFADTYGSTTVREVVSLSPFVYVFSSKAGPIMAGGLTTELFLDEDEMLYLGNIND